MAPKRKHTGKNGFYWFMLEFKSKQGRSLKSMEEVSVAAGAHWQHMSKEQREPYEIKAQMERNNVRPAKFTSDGLDIEMLLQMERNEQKRIEEMKEEINQEIKMASRTRHLQDKMFFIIHINIFCLSPSENRYYPAEIGIAGFNLENGVLPENIFHRMIQPGSLPLGFAAIAKLHSDKTHKLSLPPAGNAENNLEQVFTDMKQFLQSKMKGSRRMPILYCNQKYMKKIQLILDTWSLDYDEGETLFKVYNLQYMFLILRNAVAGDNVWPSDSFSSREIEKDVNAYATGICCEYHTYTSVPIYCSRSIAVRYAFTICDNCCYDLNIPYVPGRHVPETARIPSDSKASSVASVKSYKSGRSRGTNSSIQDDDSCSVISFSSKSEWENQSVTSETSSSHAIHDDEDFPSLRQGKRKESCSSASWTRVSPNDSSSVFSQSSTKSFAGATGTSGLSRRPADMPSSVMSSFEKLSLDSSKSSYVFGGRGTPISFNGEDDFLSLGKGRGSLVSRGRGIRRPNSGR